MVFYKVVTSAVIISSCFVFKDSCHAGRNKTTGEFTENRHLERKNSFRNSLLLFQNAETQNNETIKTKNNTAHITSNNSSSITPNNTEFDDWSDSEEEIKEQNPRFSLGAHSRLKNTQKRMKNGESPEEIQQNSKFWYERNSTRCTSASILQKQGQDKEAQTLINKAHADGFPGATFELAQQALKDGNVYKAGFFLRQACKNIQSASDIYDDQYLEILIAGIKTFVKARTELQEVFKDFEDDPLFQEKIKEKSKKTTSPTLLSNLDRFAETDKVEDDSVFTELLAQKFFTEPKTN